jgi:copper(I)-binding protein
MRAQQFAFALFAAAALAATAQAAGHRQGGLEVAEAWSRPAAAGTNGAGFMTVTNHGKAADTLTSVESPAAEKVEMHKTSMAGGIMSMKRLDAGLPLAPGESVTFAPGGYHLMLIRLTRPLKTGEVVPATLIFASGAKLKVEFPVRAAAEPADMHHMNHMDHIMDHMEHMHH